MKTPTDYNNHYSQQKIWLECTHYETDLVFFSRLHRIEAESIARAMEAMNRMYQSVTQTNA